MMTTVSLQSARIFSGKIATHADAQLTVLLVDDDKRYLSLCKRYLHSSVASSFTVYCVETVESARKICEEHDFDCLVIDYRLPDGTGTELINALAQMPGSSPPPAIITTADGGEDAATEAIRAGAVDYLSKRNLNSQSLSRSILNAVDKFRLTESLKQRNSDLIDANNKLLQSRREITHFYHTVSHEVKTPLAAAREFISLVRDGAGGEVTTEQHQLLELAIDSCDQIRKHFTELLDMTRLESGKLNLKLSVTSVDKLLARSIASVSELARSSKIEVSQDCQNDLHVLADPDRVVQVLSNLLSNAVKFSEADSVVTLRTRLCEQDDYLEFRVEDNGCGIAEDEKELVFDRLYQSEHQREMSSSEGFGLGLAIARDIVKLHDAHLKLSSVLNKGSVFFFQLPLVRT